MADVLIRDVPDAVHQELKRRAQAAGVSLQTYLAGVLEDHTAKPSIEEWLGRLRALPPVRASMTGAEAVAEARDELP